MIKDKILARIISDSRMYNLFLTLDRLGIYKDTEILKQIR